MNRHFNEEAALYALGALDQSKQLEIEKHVATCGACAALLAQACEDVTAICAAEPIMDAPPALATRLAATLERGAAVSLSPRRLARSWTSFAAAAAVILLALAPSTYLFEQNRAMHQAMDMQSEAIARVMASPHRTVAFASKMPGEVMYPRDGSWYCIVVRGVTQPLRVVWKHEGQMTDLGTAMPHGNVAMLYLPKSKPMEQLALVQGSEVVGEAKLLF